MRTKEQQKKYNKTYYEKNAEKMRQRARDWWEANKGSVDKVQKKEYLRAYYLAHPEKYRRTPEQQKAYNEKRKKDYADCPEIRAKATAQSMAWRKQNPIKHKAQRLKQYGITVDQMTAMMEKQGNACAICGETNTSNKNHFPVVDHCHATGAFRGILCGKCNKAIGLLMDSPKLAMAAAKYLENNGSSSAT